MEQQTQMLKKRKVFCLSPFSEKSKRSSRCVIEVFVPNWKAFWKSAGYVHTKKPFKVKGIRFNNTLQGYLQSRDACKFNIFFC